MSIGTLDTQREALRAKSVGDIINAADVESQIAYRESAGDLNREQVAELRRMAKYNPLLAQAKLDNMAAERENLQERTLTERAMRPENIAVARANVAQSQAGVRATDSTISLNTQQQLIANEKHAYDVTLRPLNEDALRQEIRRRTLAGDVDELRAKELIALSTTNIEKAKQELANETFRKQTLELERQIKEQELKQKTDEAPYDTEIKRLESQPLTILGPGGEKYTMPMKSAPQVIPGMLEQSQRVMNRERMLADALRKLENAEDKSQLDRVKEAAAAEKWISGNPTDTRGNPFTPEEVAPQVEVFNAHSDTNYAYIHLPKQEVSGMFNDWKAENRKVDIPLINNTRFTARELWKRAKQLGYSSVKEYLEKEVYEKLYLKKAPWILEREKK